MVLSDTLYVAGLPPFANEEWVAILLGRSRVKADGDGAAGARQVYLYRDARGVPSGAALVGMVSVDAVPAPSLPVLTGHVSSPLFSAMVSVDAVPAPFPARSPRPGQRRARDTASLICMERLMSHAADARAHRLRRWKRRATGGRSLRGGRSTFSKCRRAPAPAPAPAPRPPGAP